MNREVHVRICEGLGVQLPGPTRQDWGYRVVNLTFEWLYGSALLSGACLGLFGFVKLIKWMCVA
jgi:hypothetical protein